VFIEPQRPPKRDALGQVVEIYGRAAIVCGQRYKTVGEAMDRGALLVRAHASNTLSWAPDSHGIQRPVLPPEQRRTEQNPMTSFQRFRRTQIAELRPWVPGETLDDRVSISAADREAGSPKAGDMIARNPKNHDDQWLVAAAYFADNFEPLGQPTPWDVHRSMETAVGNSVRLSRQSYTFAMLAKESIFRAQDRLRSVPEGPAHDELSLALADVRERLEALDRAWRKREGE